MPTDLPPAPDVSDYRGLIGTPLGMMGNDTLGDCTAAAKGHLIQTWTGWNCPPGIVPSDADVIAFYSGSTGYDPSDPSTDQGGVMLDVANYWRQTGLAGHKIGAFAAVDPQNAEHVKQAIHLLTGIDIGVALPATAQNQTVWDVVGDGQTGDSAPGSWGGHDVPIIGYNAAYLFCITWGQVLPMTWEFFAAYCDEAYAMVSQDYLDIAHLSPNGLDLLTLQRDLQEITK